MDVEKASLIFDAPPPSYPTDELVYALPLSSVDVPPTVPSAMSFHSRLLLASPFISRSLPTDISTPSSSSWSTPRRPSDPELGASDCAYAIFSKRRQSRRTTYLLIAIILSSGLIYMLIDNFLLDDWVSARSRYTPAYLGALDTVDVPDYPDAALATGRWMSKGVVRIPGDEAHVLVPNPSALPTPPSLLQPMRRFPPSTLVPYYTTGQLPLTALPPTPNPTLDIVYTFVNASSPVLQEAKTVRAELEGLHLEGAERHWRDNGELRGAVRSAAQSLAEGLRRVHVISADFELDSAVPVVEVDEDDEEGVYEVVVDSEGEAKWRVGQVPSWLNTTAPDVGMQWHFHSEIFRLPSDGEVDSRIQGEWRDEQKWREEALPSFNSFQIESKVAWVDDLSENFILSNDDMFFLRDMATSDFHHPLLGPVFRLAPDLGLRVPPTLAPELRSDSGEWGGLQHANQLLSTRFYPKRRMYLAHVPKSMSRSLAQEASVMFAQDLSVAATRGFRESKRGKADVHFPWLVTHLQIERWREALLWTWAVARMGGVDGVWGVQAREELWSVLGLSEERGVPEVAVIIQDERATVEDMDEVMARNDWQFPEASEYLFTSLDGHLPDMPSVDSPVQTCFFDLAQCLPPNFFTDPFPVSAVDMFTQPAFSQPECGDCLIMALMNASGPRGLSAFLPAENQPFEPEVRGRREWEREEPMLPLVPDWREGDFSLKGVVRPGQDLWLGTEAGGMVGRKRSSSVDLRQYCVKLLSRYTYSLASSPTHFALSRSPIDLYNILEGWDRPSPLSMVCLNDDKPDWMSETSSADILGSWMGKRFGTWAAGWEREGWAWSIAMPPGQAAEKAEEQVADTPNPHAMLADLAKGLATGSGE